MLVGSHNSAAYRLNFDVGFWPKFSKWNMLRIGAKYIPAIRNSIVKLTKTQDLSIYKQLEAGIEVFDIRISWAENKFWVTHTFCLMDLEEVLTQIEDFFKHNVSSTTRIVLMIKPDAANSSTVVGHEQHLLRQLKLWHVGMKHFASIDFIYEPINLGLEQEEIVRNREGINRVWFNVNNTTDFATRFEATEFTSKDCVDCVLTPTEDEKKLCKTLKDSLEQYATYLRPVVTNLFIKRFTSGKQLPRIAMFDYVDSDLCKSIDRITSI